jgi:predicted acetyltransferase
VTHHDSWFGYLGTGGVREAFRGRGVYRALLAARARDARERGARFLLVDAQPTSEPILRRMGFEVLTSTWPCVWSPEPSSPTPSPF